MARHQSNAGWLLAGLLTATLGSATAQAQTSAGGTTATTPATTARSATSPRDTRQAAIEVQRRLRAEHRAREAARRAEARDERCINGQRMQRVANGWVDAGRC